MKKVLYILITAISIMAISGCGMKNTVQIGTGDVNGTYYAYGTELSEILNSNSDVNFKVRKTAGSAANTKVIRLLPVYTQRRYKLQCRKIRT